MFSKQSSHSERTLYKIASLSLQAVEEEDEDKKEKSPVKPDEELVHNKEKTEEEEMEDIKRQALMPKQPDQVKLEEMRRFKLKQKLMYKIIREIMSYMVFVLILLTVAYGNRDYRSHHVNNALTSYFMGGTYAGKMAIGDVSGRNISSFERYGTGWRPVTYRVHTKHERL